MVEREALEMLCLIYLGPGVRIPLPPLLLCIPYLVVQKSSERKLNTVASLLWTTTRDSTKRLL